MNSPAGDDNSTGPLRRLGESFRHESAAGIAVSAGAVVAIVWSFVDFPSYQRVIDGKWTTPWLAAHNLNSLHSFTVNGLMTIFFLVVGLELAGELRDGHLADRRAAVLPVAAAVGGMVATAGIFAAAGAFLHNPAIVRGWAVPTATDIAFALGALALVGRRVPASLRVFLLTLAVADDILAVLVLAIFYQSHTRPIWLLIAAVVVVVLTLVRRQLPVFIYWLALFIVWASFTAARIEPALAGVLVGVLVPIHKGGAGRQMERGTLPWSNAVVLPLFALCACGLPWSQLDWSTSTRQIVGSVFAARIIGKVVGITGVVFIGSKLALRRPEGVSMFMMCAASVLCAVGFTVPLLFAESLYGFESANYDAVTLGLLITTVCAGVVGVVLMRLAVRPTRRN